MKELVIISGKGGTGKTSITAALAHLAESPVLCDADVDAADLHLLMKPEILERHEFSGGSLAVIEPATCSGCGTCLELCRFDAVSESYHIDPLLCEGCGVCADFCPEKAIAMIPQKSGEWFVSATATGPMVHARLGIGEENSGKLVSLIRQEARKRAEENGRALLLTDGPPGIGCPVIASLSGADMVAVVVEPTVSGKHDVERVIQLTRHFNIPAAICINRWDINAAMTAEIARFATAEKIPLLPRIPFDPLFVEALVAGKTIIEYAPESPTSRLVETLWRTLSTLLVTASPPPVHLQQYTSTTPNQRSRNL